MGSKAVMGGSFINPQNLRLHDLLLLLLYSYSTLPGHKILVFKDPSHNAKTVQRLSSNDILNTPRSPCGLEPD